MKNLTFALREINLMALDTQLREIFSDEIYGISSTLDTLTVHLVDNFTEDQQRQVEALVESHNPAILTPHQGMECEHKKRLEALRGENNQPIDLTQFEGTDEAFQRLAEKVAWLEQEILVLRGNVS